MRRIVLHILALVLGMLSVQFTSAQYDYYNMSIGTDETSTNLEVIDSLYYIMGVDNSGASPCWFVRVFTESGTQVDEACYTEAGEFQYVGLTNTLQSTPQLSGLLHTQGLVQGGQVKGSAMLIDLELDTVWKRIYDTYAPDTYFTTHTWDGDGWIIAGETVELGVGRGTFIMKIDMLGEVLWHELNHEPSEGIFRNLDVSIVVDGYIWSGGDGVLSETEGYIEFINESLESEFLLSGDGGVERLYMRHLKWSTDSIIVFQPIADSYVPGGGAATYRKLRIYLLELDNPSLQTLVDFEPYPNWINGYGIKMLRIGDSSIVMGTFHSGPNSDLRTESFLVKFNEEFQSDWYTELSYEICSGCTNELYDIEQAPDGGYVMVDKFNSPEDPYDKTWLVKVDACGDMEWQGCEPVGIEEIVKTPSIKIFPNPASSLINIEVLENIDIHTIEIIDMMGRTVLRSSYSSSLDLSHLPSGAYKLIISGHSASFQVVR